MDKECTTEKKWSKEECLEAIDEALELLKNGPTKEQQAWNDGYMCSMNRVAHLISHCNKIIKRWDELKDWLLETRKHETWCEMNEAYDNVINKMEELEENNG